MATKTANNYLWDEFREYTEANNLSKYERKLFRDWVRWGHSVYETVQSGYSPGLAYSPMDFPDAYRLDRELAENMKGMTRAEKNEYLKAYICWEDPSPEEIAMENARKKTPYFIKNRVKRLERELFNLWKFISQEGLEEEAREYVEDRRDEEIPFEW